VLLALRDVAGNPYHWLNPPKGFAAWRDGWVVCDNTTRLLQFDRLGRFVRALETGVRSDRIAVAGGRLVLHNLVATGVDEQFSISSDGRAFVKLALPRTPEFHSPLDNLVLVAGGPHGEIYSGAIIGPPVLYFQSSSQQQQRHEIRVAYSRALARSQKEHPAGVVDDVAPYSQPFRDLYVLDDGRVVVLRNREDVRSAGKISELVGQRADLYDSRGKHLRTAIFPTTLRWITRGTGSEVTGVTRDGGAVTVPWGDPVEGEVLR
jgi:hypothetical protein